MALMAYAVRVKLALRCARRRHHGEGISEIEIVAAAAAWRAMAVKNNIGVALRAFSASASRHHFGENE